jgi:hypothetical protein
MSQTYDTAGLKDHKSIQEENIKSLRLPAIIALAAALLVPMMQSYAKAANRHND